MPNDGHRVVGTHRTLVMSLWTCRSITGQTGQAGTDYVTLETILKNEILIFPQPFVPTMFSPSAHMFI